MCLRRIKQSPAFSRSIASRALETCHSQSRSSSAVSKFTRGIPLKNFKALGSFQCVVVHWSERVAQVASLHMCSQSFPVNKTYSTRTFSTCASRRLFGDVPIYCTSSRELSFGVRRC